MIWTHVAAAILALVLGFGSGWKVRAWKAGADDAQRIEAEQSDAAKARGHAAQVVEAHEAKREAREQQARIIEREVTRVVEKPVYRNLCLDDDGLRILAEALGAPGSAAQPAPALRAASAPD